MDQISDQSNIKPSNQSPQKGIDLAEVLRYRLKGYTQADIAAKLDIAPSTVSQRLSTFGMMFDVDAVKAYKTSRVEILTATEAMLLSELWDPTRRAKASLNNLAYAYAQIHNSRRLEEGVATSIVDTGINNMRLIDVINRRAILMSQLKSIAIPSTVDTEQPQDIMEITPDTP